MNKRRWAVWLTTILIMIMMVIPVQGHEIPDEDHRGSISLVMKDGSSVVPGGTLVLYRVGDVVESDGNYSFALTEDTRKSGVSLENIQSPETAQKLADWVEKRFVQQVEVKINDKGQAKFSNLKPGLYLIVQTEAAEEYMPADPFLVSLPMYDGSTYLYDVEATPKVELEKAPVQTEPEVTKPDQIKDPQLPQTGQNNWPIPVLACIGLVLVLFGAFLCCSRQKNDRKQ